MTDSNIVEYGQYELDAADEEHEDLSRAQGQYMRLQVGRNAVRILPPPIGRRSPFVTVYQHFLHLPGVPEPITFNCPRIMDRRFCPSCAKSDKLRNSGNPADAEGAREFWANRRVYCNVIDRSDEGAGPKILPFGKTVHEALVSLRRNEDVGGDYTHPYNGFDIVIERTGTGKNDTRYKVLPARRSSELGNMEWIAQQPDLQALQHVPSLEEIKELVRSKKAAGAAELPPAPELPPASGHRSRAASGGGRTAQDDLEEAPPHGDDDNDIPF